MTENPLDYSQLNHTNTDALYFESIVCRDKVPPVLLFHGRGSLHKCLVAAKLCALLICKTKKACGECHNCLALKQDRHPSVLFIDNKERIISVEETLSIKRHLLSASGSPSDPRIVFIRDVERLSEQSTNKLLKIFEELAPFSFVFMTTERRHALLETLLSRSVPYLLKNKEEKEPLFTEKVQKLAITFMEKAFNSQYTEVFELCDELKKDSQLTLEEIIEAQELALNQSYKALLNGAVLKTAENLARKKKHIVLLRKTILDQKIKLNKALVLESLFIN
jgi:DNA polymerase III gamma/tau subunit